MKVLPSITHSGVIKKSFLFLLIIVNVCSAKKLLAQQTLSVKNLVGVWQYESPTVGDELNQSFAFFGNRNFFFNNGKLGDDLVSTGVLKGRYRLDKNKIYFTIISRTIIDNANIGVKNSAIDFGIFQYNDIVPRVITEKKPKEIEDPAIITFIKPNHIKINDEDYYKVSSDPNAASKL
ncbi:MAG TPA: hypothetical protein VK668_01965 [Mucilaginibacter sp.]|nr:hypothetical protein [Mucilaginibacter sp.]